MRQSLVIAVEICSDRPLQEMESDKLEYLNKVLTICREIEDFETESTITSILNKH